MVLYHVAIAGGPAPLACLYLGYSGVSFFFILSGFILTYTYIEPGGALRSSAAAFWGARVARVLPVYLLALALAIPPYLWFRDPRATPVLTELSTLTFTQAWLPWSADAWNGPSWSLSDEAFFYALFPFIAPLVARISRRGLNLAGNLFWLAGLSAAIMYIAINPDHLTTWGSSDTTLFRILRFDPLIRLPEFLLGLALGRMFVLDRATIRPSRLRGMALSLATFGSLEAIILAPASGIPLPTILVTDGLLNPIFALLIYSLAWGDGGAAKLFAAPILVALGEASYALYLIHIPLHIYFQRLFPAPVPATPSSYLYWSCYLLLCIVLALVIYRWVERPARRSLRRLFARHGSAIATTALRVRLQIR